jgi:hypothetical protein
VGRREGIGGGARVIACLEVAVAAARAAAVVLVVASRGILLGPCFAPTPFTGDSGVDSEFELTAAVPARRMLAAPAVDRVTRVGRCSDAVTPRAADTFDMVFDLLRVVGGALIAGRVSFSSSSSVSSAILFALGVFLGWPGGTIVFVLAAADAI